MTQSLKKRAPDGGDYEEWLRKKMAEKPWNFEEGSDRALSSASFWLETAMELAPAPRTIVIALEHTLDPFMDNIDPLDWPIIRKKIEKAANRLGWPCFLRTDFTSGKHNWEACCGGLLSPEDIRDVVVNLVHFSGIIDHPVGSLLARELLPTLPAFHAFGGTPVTREFRLFTNHGVIEHVQPYWPEDAIRDGEEGWKEKLRHISALSRTEFEALADITLEIGEKLPQKGWSVDWLQDACGCWHLTDMAVDSISYKWEAPFEVVDDAICGKAMKKGIIPEKWGLGDRHSPEFL